MNNASNGFSGSMGFTTCMGCFMRKTDSIFRRGARWACLVLGIGVGVGGSNVLAQAQYPGSTPSSGYGTVVPPPAFPSAPAFVAPGGSNSTVVPLPPTSNTGLPLPPNVGVPKAPATLPLQNSMPLTSPMYINQQPPGQSVPGPGAPDAPSAALIDQRIKAYMDAQAAKKKAEDDQKAAEAAQRGTEVVNNVPVTITFNNSFWMSGADNAFRVRVGAYAQYDTSWWLQPGNTIPPVVAPNVSEGLYQDGIFVRRMRIELEGTLWETWEFQVYPEFEGVNRLLYDELWFGAKDIPIIGTLRFGKDKIPQGMESIGSSKDVWFMERSVLFDTFEAEYGLGIYQTRTFFNDRMTMMMFAGKWDITEFSFNEGDIFDSGGWAAAGRLTFLPIYECDGRYLLHLGVSAQWRQPNLDLAVGQFFPTPAPGTSITPTTANTGIRIARFRTRADLRDATGVGNLVNTQGASVIGWGDGDGVRLLDSGNLSCTDVSTINTELYAVWGRFSLLNETSLNYIANAAIPVAAPATVTAIGNQFFWGTSTQVSCFLTGENRTYNKRYGTYARVIPNENAWLVRDEDGAFNGGLGAWEVLFRYEYINADVLNTNVAGSPGVVAGSGAANSYTVGLNWHLNPNMRVMFNYTVFDRYINPSTTSAAAPNFGGLSVHDVTQGFGTRFHFQF
jgi:phosphate-selective porin OprO and OprP